MSFRDNMQHLRATRNMTQEQLAMLLGVSRQSVSKWEAERAYPEMDKLLRMCALFECTLDELVCGDLTARPAAEASSVPAGKPQDVTGYDQAMRTFAWKLPLGIAVIILGAALALLLSDPALMPTLEVRNFATALVFVGAAAGLALILPSSTTSTRPTRKSKPERPFRRASWRASPSSWRGWLRPSCCKRTCGSQARCSSCALRSACSSSCAASCWDRAATSRATTAGRSAA